MRRPLSRANHGRGCLFPHRQAFRKNFTLLTAPSENPLPFACSYRQSLEFVGYEALGETGDETPDEGSRIVDCVGGVT